RRTTSLRNSLRIISYLALWVATGAWGTAKLARRTLLLSLKSALWGSTAILTRSRLGILARRGRRILVGAGRTVLSRLRLSVWWSAAGTTKLARLLLTIRWLLLAIRLRRSVLAGRWLLAVGCWSLLTVWRLLSIGLRGGRAL